MLQLRRSRRMAEYRLNPDRDGTDFGHKSEVFFGKLGAGEVTAK
jgi:hypothetical protein